MVPTLVNHHLLLSTTRPPASLQRLLWLLLSTTRLPGRLHTFLLLLLC
jgi:hypothetical protein